MVRRVQIMRSGAALAATALLLSACATPVGVKRLEPREAYHLLTQSALTRPRASEPSEQVLRRLGLAERFGQEPAQVLDQLHADLAASGDEDRLFALAELSFVHAERSGDRDYYLAAAVYAYALLFPGGADPGLPASDPRVRLAHDLYNLGLAESFCRGGCSRSDLTETEHKLPFGTLTLAFEPLDYSWLGYSLERFEPAATLDIRGLRNRYRRPGIGAAMIGRIGASKPATGVVGSSRIPQRVTVAMTMFLRLTDPRTGLSRRALDGRVELYTEDRAVAVEIGGRRHALEVDRTAALASLLEGAPIYDFEYDGFLNAGLIDSWIPKDRAQDGIFLVQPVRRDRIPVVLVHGTASSPARWAELVNELTGDPRIHDRYQIWFFIYSTGNPIGYSAGRLRQALANIVKEVDPEGTSEALRQMVVIGHSQGGILTKLTSIESGSRFWDNVSDEPLDSLPLDDQTRGVLRASLFFTPEPFVKRVIFVATPHRGSYLAGWRLAQIVSRLVSLPVGILKRGAEVVSATKDEKLLHAMQRMPTSIENMSPLNRFVKTLASIPIAPGIAAHSIIAVQGSGPFEQGRDGLVTYESAHITPVASELVVRSGHSVQGNPACIEEIRRILLEHAASGS